MEKDSKKEVVEKSVKKNVDPKLFQSIVLLVLLLGAAIFYDFSNLSKLDEEINYGGGLNGLMAKYPWSSIFIVGILISLFSSLMMKLFLDQEHLKKLKKKQKTLQAELKECQKKQDFCQVEKLNSEMMQVSMDMMKSSFSLKQFIVTFVPFLLLFTWLRRIYVGGIVGWTEWGFILKYMIAVMVSSTVYKKIFNLA